MNARIPAVLQPLLNNYLQAIDACLPGFLTGLYLHGSIALDAFDPRWSDVDFVAVISRRATASDCEHLVAVHAQIAAQYPQWALEGSYLQVSDIGRLDDAVEPYPHFADTLRPDEHNALTLVTWWLLKTHGIAVHGAAPESLDFTVDWSLLVTQMHENLNTYWAQFARPSQRALWLLSDYGIQWAVLGVLRQYYSFREGDITSKTGAGAYALAHVPAAWHPLIREALRIREQGGGNRKWLRVRDAVTTMRFVRYVIDTCNASLAATPT